MSANEQLILEIERLKNENISLENDIKLIIGNTPNGRLKRLEWRLHFRMQEELEKFMLGLRQPPKNK